MCPTLTVGSFFYSRKVHFFVHLFNNLNYGGSKHSNLRSASKKKRKNKTRPEPRKHTKDRTRLKGPPFRFFSALRDFFRKKFPKGSPSIFKMFCDRWMLENPKGSPHSVFFGILTFFSKSFFFTKGYFEPFEFFVILQQKVCL